MTDPQKPRHTPKTDEPNYLPSQSEGSADQEPLTEHLRTPDQAEGSREDVEETLRKAQKKKQDK